MNTLLLDALSCTNRRRFPVWLMRQAGRILPSYRELRSRYELHELFHHTELIAHITCLPVHELKVDAAILFTDILTVVELLGKRYAFNAEGGPVVLPPIETTQDVDDLQIIEDANAWTYLSQAIPLIKGELDVPLIGFCGGPLTVAAYLLSGGREALSEWIAREPQSVRLLLKKVTEASMKYLMHQIEAGVDVVQIFDSWAGLLPEVQFKTFALPYLTELAQCALEQKMPVILFTRGSTLFVKDLSAINPTAISFDWNLELDQLRAQVPEGIAIQGNLNPDLLKLSQSTVRKETLRMIEMMRGEKRYIANLGHGVHPDTPLHNVKTFINTVKNYS